LARLGATREAGERTWKNPKMKPSSNIAPAAPNWLSAMPQPEELPMVTQKMPCFVSPDTIQGPSAAAHASAKPAADSTIEAIEVGVRL
jgi:hypothetical protein